MTFSSVLALFSAMLVLALLPSLSVMTVLARSAALGFRHGAVTSLGIVMGDIVYILLAIYGLAVLAEQMADLIVIIQYLGAAYLIWLGLSLWRFKSKALEVEATAINASWISSFLAGFLLTLGDQKAVFFYLSFFPAFVDLSVLSLADTGIVVAIAVAVIGGVKLGYAALADRSSRRFMPKPQASRAISLAAGTVMIGVGIAILIKG